MNAYCIWLRVLSIVMVTCVLGMCLTICSGQGVHEAWYVIR